MRHAVDVPVLIYLSSCFLTVTCTGRLQRAAWGQYHAQGYLATRLEQVGIGPPTFPPTFLPTFPPTPLLCDDVCVSLLLQPLGP